MTEHCNVEAYMEVVGADGQHIGTVDHQDGPDKIRLATIDPNSGGRYRFIQVDWIDHVTGAKVHLKMPAKTIKARWERAA